MKELSLSPPEEEEYTETCPFCKSEIDEIVFVRDNEIIGCESCIKQHELSEWAEKNYISKADIEAEKADMERDFCNDCDPTGTSFCRGDCVEGTGDWREG